MFIADAVEIFTNEGLGIPTSYTNPAIGLVAGGVIALITGRNTITTATGATTRTNWVKDVLAKGDGDFLPSIAGEFVVAGGFAKYSTVSFSVLNTGGLLVADLENHGVYLGQRRIKVYRATSTDGVTWAFVLRFTGVIQDQPYDESVLKIQCVSTAFDIFKSLPAAALPTDPDDESESGEKDRLLPIIMGRVAHAQLIPVRKSGDKVILTDIDGETHFTAASFQYTEGTDADGDDYYWLRLFTKGIQFTDDDPRLVGKYVSVVAGGPAQIIGIESVFASVMYVDGYGTQLKLRAPLDVTGAPYQAWSMSLDFTNIWYFQVADLAPPMVVAGRPVSEYLAGGSGAPAISLYSTEKKSYTDVSEIAPVSSLSNISGTGLPGFVAIARSGESNGSLNTYQPIYPIGAKVVAVTGWTSEDVPAVGADAPRLYDRLEDDAANYYTLTAAGPGSVSASLSFDLFFKADESLKSYAEIYALVDFNHKMVLLAHGVYVTVHMAGIDIYGRVTQDLDVGRDVYNGTLGTALSTLNFLPRRYFNTSGSDKKFYSGKSVFIISPLIGNTKNSTAYNRIRVRLSFTASAMLASVYALYLKEIGFVAKMSISVTSDPLYVGLIGEKFESTWDGRMLADQPIHLVGDMLEGLIRKYDTPGAPWRIGAYKVGQKVRGTLDTGHIFVCTVSGTTGATEPAWADTTGATYVDGGVTWKELMEIPIDKTSFDIMGSRRWLWFGGLNLRDRRPSEEVYKAILAQTFTLGLINTSGNVEVKNWLDDETPLMTFDASNIIPGTLGEMKPTPTDQVYNEILIQYDENPGGNDFNRRLFITRIDEPEFPDESELATPAVDLGAFSVSATALGLGNFRLEVYVTHSLKTGDYAMLVGNLDGFDFPPTPISVVGGGFQVFVSGYYYGTSTSGTLSYVADQTPLWKTFVVGVRNYSTGRNLWQPLHDAYRIDMVINRLPEELGNCRFFIDPYAKDSAGALLWPDLDVGDDHPAVWYAQYLARWTPWKKKQVPLQVYDAAAYNALNYGDCVAVNDQHKTQGVNKIGWIHEKTYLAGSGTNDPERILFGITFKPDQLVEYDIIDENGATDIIDENGATDIIDEN